MKSQVQKSRKQLCLRLCKAAAVETWSMFSSDPSTLIPEVTSLTLPHTGPPHQHFLFKLGFSNEKKKKNASQGNVVCNSFFDKVTFVCDTFFSSEELQKVQISGKSVWKFHALTSSKYFCYYLLIFLGSRCHTWRTGRPRSSHIWRF